MKYKKGGGPDQIALSVFLSLFYKGRNSPVDPDSLSVHSILSDWTDRGSGTGLGYNRKGDIKLNKVKV